MMFQSYALWPHMSVAANIGYGLRMRGWKKDAIAARVDEMLEAAAARGLRPAAGDAAVGRPAPARRAGPRARGRSVAAAARRADVEPRLQGAARAAPRAPRAAAARRHHRGLRDARPRGGADARRPHRRHRRRPHRAVRHARGGVPPAVARVRRRLHGRRQRARRRRARRRHAGRRRAAPAPARAVRAHFRGDAARLVARRGAGAGDALLLPGVIAQASTSGRATAIASAPAAPTSGCTRRSGWTKARPRCGRRPARGAAAVSPRIPPRASGGFHAHSASCLPPPSPPRSPRRRRPRADHAQRRHRRRPEHGRLRQQLPRAEVRGDESGRQGARGRHRPGRRRLAEDLREALGAAEGGHRRVGHRRRGRPPARRRDDGQREAADAVPQRHRRRQARLARHREERARRQRRRLRDADVPQPDRVRLQPGPRQGAAEVATPSWPSG